MVQPSTQSFSLESFLSLYGFLSIDAGVLSSDAPAGSNVLNCSGRNWEEDCLVGKLIEMYEGVGAPQTHVIKNNSQTAVITEGNVTPAIKAGAKYRILGIGPKDTSLISYSGAATSDGGAGGATLVCSGLTNYPDYNGNLLVILSGPYKGQSRDINGITTGGTVTPTSSFSGVITTGTKFTIFALRLTPAEVAALQADVGDASSSVLGSLFGILGNPAMSISDMLTLIVASVGMGPSVGLWMPGVCSAAMVGSTTELYLSNLAGTALEDNLFNENFYIEVLYNANNVGVAPESEIQKITGFVSATGHFTTDAFTADVEAGDLVAVIHHTLIGPELNLISTLIRMIFDIVNAGLVLTGAEGTITTDGTEQNIYINNAPAGLYEPLIVKVDLTDLAAAETVVLRTYYRLIAGGGLILEDEVAYNGVQAIPSKPIVLTPNRYGIQVTLERTAGVARDHDWGVIYRV